MTMAKKVAKRRWAADPLAAIRLVSRVTPGGADSAARQTIVRAMFDRLMSGSADPEDYDRVFKALNTAAVRAIEIGEPMLIDVTYAGLRALGECRRRYMDLGTFGFSGPEINAMHEALEAYEAIESASSIAQMESAWDAARKILARRATQGAEKT